MKTLVIVIITAFPAVAQQGHFSADADVTTDERIQQYEKRLTSNPGAPKLQSALVAAYIQKLRETGDRGYLERASNMVDAMLSSDPGNFEAMRFLNEIDLQKHDFSAVYDRSRAMLRYEPSDAGTWGNLGDASMELGRYEEAERSYIRMFAIRPSLASYNRLGWLRFVTGDADSALALMQQAVAAGGNTPENAAWCEAELGDMYFKTGKLEAALKAYEDALDLFPRLHRALAGRGRVEAARGQIAAAIHSYESAQAILPLIDYAGMLEDLYLKAGMTGKAAQQQELTDIIDRLGAIAGETTNRNLALILANHRRKLDHALALVEAEVPSRPDVYTLDALSWVLFQTGRIEEAKVASDKALVFGTPEPMFYQHAGMIAQALHQNQRSIEMLSKALALNPAFDPLQAFHTSESLEELKAKHP